MRTKLFSNPSSKLNQLIECVQTANYRDAEEIVLKCPKLIFQPVVIQSQLSSPLQLAFTLLDTHMWQLFLERIKDDLELVTAFYQQAKAQEKHIDLKSLTFTYENFD